MGLLDGSLVTLVDHETVSVEVGTVVPAVGPTTILQCALHSVIDVYIDLALRQKHQN